MLGLDAAGKTTILYKLHIGEVLSTVPTIGQPPSLPSTLKLSHIECTVHKLPVAKITDVWNELHKQVLD